jgi:hypothetical protein
MNDSRTKRVRGNAENISISCRLGEEASQTVVYSKTAKIWSVVATTRRLLAVGFWQPLADAGGKIGRVVCGLCSFSVVAACSKVREGQVCVDLTPFVKELIEVAVGEPPPVQASACARGLRVSADRGRAILRQGVVPSRMVREPINFIEVINQQSPCL